MSFSSDVKDELYAKIDNAKHCQIAELAAFMAFGGAVWHTPDNTDVLFMTTENEVVASKFADLLQKTFGILKEDINYDYEGPKNSIIHMSLDIQEDVRRILMALKWREKENAPIKPVFVHPILIQKECCKRAFIRGAFMVSGSISDPHKFYHYEVVCNTQNDAETLKELFDFFKLEAKVIQRKKNYVVYIKEGNNITDCLNLMGAFVSQMNLTNVMILKDMRNDVNRKVNCETANLNKTIEAAVKQIKDIEYIRDTVGLNTLNRALYDVAVVRLENPDMNLKDIGELLTPQVGKSGVNHRLRKISEIAQKLRGE